MPLFQQTVVTKYLNTQDTATLRSRWQIFQEHFHNPAIQENIRNSKEEQYQGEFLIDLFVNVLGYTKNPTPDFNLTTEYKNVKDSKKADGAIIFNEEVKAVIELKGTETTDLGKVETQAFGYKNNQPKCKYVITSNFEKLRFYIDNATEHLEFNLFTLEEKDFQLLYLCLAQENIEKDIPQKIKNASLSKEGEITKQLYKDYSLFKRELHQNLVALNPQFDALTLFKKSQKLLDRFLFLFFAEDRALLPPNSVRLVLSDWKELIERDEQVHLIDRFKKYFGYLNTGFKGKRYDVYPYNGGLFKPDEVLDHILIDDVLLYDHTLKLSEYNFESEVDVNILGHIFENSLTEIEEVEAELTGQQTEKTKSKRKKDGVFYTPKYITKYIVENTVGKLCEQKKAEFDITDENYQPAKQRSRKRIDNLQAYREWLLGITICDPACGSGAFLNQALEFLIAEHRYIDELSAKYNQDAFVLSEVENSILENNLFGVDINEESVEIAKLSLWLRTAQKNRKLNDLSHNIKCGNSLIDDPEFAGDKAFKWEEEFKTVFDDGGFDVVIGNPPYVKARDNDDIKSRNFIELNYKTAYKMWDLYIPFIEKSIELLKNNGNTAMIIPDTLGKADYTTQLINLVEENYYLYQIDFFPNLYVFENVGVRSKIPFIQKTQSTKLATKISHTPTLNDTVKINKALKKGNEQYLLEVADFTISKIDCVLLEDICYVSYGMRLNSDKNDPEKFKKVDLLSNIPTTINIKKYTEGKYIDRYIIKEEKYMEWGTERSPYRLVRPTFPELYPTNKLLLSRQKRIATYSNENHYCDNTIIMAIKAEDLKNVANNSIDKYYTNIGKDRRFIEKLSQEFDLKYLLSVINSKLIAYFIKFESKGKIDFYPDDWKKIPIRSISLLKQKPFIEKAEQLLHLNSELLDISQKFQRSIQRNFQIETLPKKLENWHELTFANFVNELKKKKVVLSLTQQAEWEDYFLQEQQKANAIKTEINRLDAEIDALVYNLYGLTEEEIKIIEGS